MVERCGMLRRGFQNLANPRMEAFQTQHTGWGVRACQPIAKGNFIIEYAGAPLALYIVECHSGSCQLAQGNWITKHAGAPCSVSTLHPAHCHLVDEGGRAPCFMNPQHQTLEPVGSQLAALQCSQGQVRGVAGRRVSQSAAAAAWSGQATVL